MLEDTFSHITEAWWNWLLHELNTFLEIHLKGLRIDWGLMLGLIVRLLKGYSGLSLIHGLTYCEAVLDSLSRDQVCRPRADVVLASSETTARQQYIAANGSKYKTAIKKPQIMLRTAPNFSNIRNRVPAHISRHQTFDIVAIFVGIESNTVSRCVRPRIKLTPETPLSIAIPFKAVLIDLLYIQPRRGLVSALMSKKSAHFFNCFEFKPIFK